MDDSALQVLHSTLGSLKKTRNEQAHTHLQGVTRRLDAPSVRWTKACSYADQCPTRYFVLYFGWTFDLMSRSCTRSGHRGQRAYSCLVAAEGLCTNASSFRVT